MQVGKVGKRTPLVCLAYSLANFTNEKKKKKAGGAAMQHESAAGSRAKSSRLKHWL